MIYAVVGESPDSLQEKPDLGLTKEACGNDLFLESSWGKQNSRNRKTHGHGHHIRGHSVGEILIIT